MKYSELKNQQPELHECFFAFSNQQFVEGLAKIGKTIKEIVKGPAGLFGTQEGIQKLFDDYEAIDKQIVEQCTPQEVYDYEFSNHECDYVGDDKEAIDIVIDLFGIDKAKTVKRSHGYSPIE